MARRRRSERPWIARVLFTVECRAKLLAKHQLSYHQVVEAVCFYAYRSARWHQHPVYGRRLLVEGEAYDGTRLRAFLAPVDEGDGTWQCTTAMRLPK